MNVKTIFDSCAMQYDLNRQKIIPYFEIFYNTVVELIPFKPEESFSFLDLGAGTGLLTALILNAFPGAMASVVDISEKMLYRAKQRFTNNSNVTIFAMDYAETTPPGVHDLVVSAMSIHHLVHTEKNQLMEKIYKVLKPGGIFINADLVESSTAAVGEKYHRHWMDYLKKADLSADELAAVRKRMTCDLPATLDSQLMWMQQAGFIEVDCYYKYFNFVVYSGKKT